MQITLFCIAHIYILFRNKFAIKKMYFSFGDNTFPSFNNKQETCCEIVSE